MCQSKKENVGHLKKRATGRFPKTILFFLWSNPYSNSSVQINGKRCNLVYEESKVYENIETETNQKKEILKI